MLNGRAPAASLREAIQSRASKKVVTAHIGTDGGGRDDGLFQLNGSGSPASQFRFTFGEPRSDQSFGTYFNAFTPSVKTRINDDGVAHPHVDMSNQLQHNDPMTRPVKQQGAHGQDSFEIKDDAVDDSSSDSENDSSEEGGSDGQAPTTSDHSDSSDSSDGSIDSTRDDEISIPEEPIGRSPLGRHCFSAEKLRAARYQCSLAQSRSLLAAFESSQRCELAPHSAPATVPTLRRPSAPRALESRHVPQTGPHPARGAQKALSGAIGDSNSAACLQALAGAAPRPALLFAEKAEPVSTAPPGAQQASPAAARSTFCAAMLKPGPLPLSDAADTKPSASPKRPRPEICAGGHESEHAATSTPVRQPPGAAADASEGLVSAVLAKRARLEESLKEGGGDLAATPPVKRMQPHKRMAGLTGWCL
eukprot:jgi/Ulvmu1/8568/UM045_0010.1